MEKKKVTTEAKTHKKRVAAVGALMVALATIGLITLLVLLINFAVSFFSDDRQKQEFETLIYPVVMLDPPTFSRAEQADNTMLVKASIWNAVINEGKEKYTDPTSGLLIVPTTDIEKYCAKLFGPGISLGYTSFGDVITPYTYLEDQSAYEVPLEGSSGMYTPKVIKITRDGQKYQLLVGYIPPGFAWGNSGGEEVPDKFMIYTLTKESGNYYLVSVSDAPASEIPSEYSQPLQGESSSSSTSVEGSGSEESGSSSSNNTSSAAS